VVIVYAVGALHLSTMASHMIRRCFIATNMNFIKMCTCLDHVLTFLLHIAKEPTQLTMAIFHWVTFKWEFLSNKSILNQQLIQPVSNQTN